MMDEPQKNKSIAPEFKKWEKKYLLSMTIYKEKRGRNRILFHKMKSGFKQKFVDEVLPAKIAKATANLY